MILKLFEIDKYKNIYIKFSILIWQNQIIFTLFIILIHKNMYIITNRNIPRLFSYSSKISICFPFLINSILCQNVRIKYEMSHKLLLTFYFT